MKSPPQDGEWVGLSALARTRFHRVDGRGCAVVILDYFWLWPDEVAKMNSCRAVPLTPCLRCFGDGALRPGTQGRIPDDVWALKEVP